MAVVVLTAPVDARAATTPGSPVDGRGATKPASLADTRIARPAKLQAPAKLKARQAVKPESPSVHARAQRQRGLAAQRVE